jgi:thymidylate synthase ThyX
MSYLEQSTRYIAYDARLGGRYRFFRDPQLMASRLGTRYVGELDRLFDAYSDAVATVTDHVRSTFPKDPADTDFVYRQATRAKALDATRGMLPAASLSNVGIYGTGQAFEALLLRLRAHPLPEARAYAEMMLDELRKVIPSFLRRVDIPERGGRWVEYFTATRADTASLVDELLAAEPVDDAPAVTLVDFDPDAEDKLLAAVCYPYTHLPEAQILERVRKLSTDERVALITAYVGERENRRHKPGRAFERVDYRFDVLSDYGAFRDLQRHRMLTIDWQPLTPDLGYVRPDLIDDAGEASRFDEAMERSAALYRDIAEIYPEQASYAVAMAYRVRYVMQFNAREAIHLIELRSGSQGHPAYRRVALEMHRLIAEQAGHTAIAAAMSHLTTDAPELERLEAERRAESRRR